MAGQCYSQVIELFSLISQPINIHQLFSIFSFEKYSFLCFSFDGTAGCSIRASDEIRELAKQWYDNLNHLIIFC